MPKPLGHIVHTMGWPLRKRRQVRRVRRLLHLSDGRRTWSRSASSPGSSTATSSSRSTTCCRSSRRTSSCARSSADGERIAWGAKTITEGGFHALPKRFHAPGLLLAGESAGLVNVPTLKGIHYAIESGIMAAEAAFRSLQRGESPSRVGALESYDEELRGELRA